MRKKTWIVTVVGLIAGAFGGVAVAPVSAAPIAHPSLLPTTPARGYPIVLGTPQYSTNNDNCPLGCTLSREAFGINQVGRYVAAGGNFFEVELQDGTVLQQKYFAAWNIDTKQFACAGAFTFNGIVRSVEPAAIAGKAYVGGDFTKITGSDGVIRTRNKVALIDLASCTIDNTFVSTGANGKINEIVLNGSRLFVGGDFTSIGGLSRSYIAELDPRTGATRPFGLTFGTTSLSSKIRGMAVSTDGSRLLFAGRFGSVSDGVRTLTTQTAVVDIAGASPVLRSHTFVQTHPEAGTRPTGQSLQDVSIFPDASAFALAYGTATVSDFVYVVNATDGSQPIRWRHRMSDSSTGIAVSNQAVYVIGHFCKIESGPGATATLAPKMGLDSCTGSGENPNGAWRTHTAALSLTDGTPLSWNAGADSRFGGQEAVVTTRGMFIGFDGQRVDSIRTGAVAFFDLGASLEDSTAPGLVTFAQPAAGASVNNPALLTGSATDNVGVASYLVRVKASDGRFVQANGSLAATAFEFKPVALANGSFEVSVTMPAGNYTAQAKAVDAAGLVSVDWANRDFTQTGIEGVPPQVTGAMSPASPIPSETAVSVSGRATDNSSVSTLEARITNAAGQYLQPNGTFDAAATAYPLTAGALNNPSVDWSASLGAGLLPGTYEVAVLAKDPSGNATTLRIPFTITAAAPVVAIANPGARVLVNAAVSVSGTVTDNAAVAAVSAQITSGANFLQDDGTFAAAANDLNMTVTGLDTASASYSFSVGTMPIGDYTLTVTARDRINNTSTATRPFVVAARAPGPAITAYAGFSSALEFFNGRTAGFTFKVNSSTQVLALGVQDTNRDGVLNNSADTPVGIWRASDQALIATVNVPRTATADGGWFYASLTTPITLQPGVTYVIGQRVFVFGEQYATGGTATAATDFVYLGSATAVGNALVYPGTQAAATGGFGMPNLKIG